MARTLNVNEFQAMQRGEGDALGDAEIGPEDVATTDPLTGNLVAATERATAVMATGPHEYDVEPSGEVRDWRRPETTPDAGPEAAETVHIVSNDDFQQGSLFLVPSDSSFNGKPYRDAPELANIAERLIGEHGFLNELVNCDVRWYWKRKTGVSKGRVKVGFMKRASDLIGHFTGADFIGWLSATTARDGKFTDRQVEAAVFHQLLHIGTDDNGNWIFEPHDFEGFAAEVRHYGTWSSDLKSMVPAVRAAQQMGLFDATDEAEDELDDEELAEHRPRDPFMGVADPDGPSPEDEPDTSGELPTDAEMDAALTDRGLV